MKEYFDGSQDFTSFSRAAIKHLQTLMEHPTSPPAAKCVLYRKNPNHALQLFPAEVPDTLGYVAFSQQMLRGLALEAIKDDKAAQQLWRNRLAESSIHTTASKPSRGVDAGGYQQYSEIS